MKLSVKNVYLYLGKVFVLSNYNSEHYIKKQITPI